MHFLTFSKANLRFAKKKLVQKSYTAAKNLSTIKRVEIINRKKFALVVLDLKDKIFVIYVAFVIKWVYPNWKTPIAGLKIEKVTILTKYWNFANVFFSDSVAELLEYSGINNLFINLEKGK